VRHENGHTLMTMSLLVEHLINDVSLMNITHVYIVWQLFYFHIGFIHYTIQRKMLKSERVCFFIL